MGTSSDTQFRLVDAGWDRILSDACCADSSRVRIVCPFIQRKPIERLFKAVRPKCIEVITRYNLDDFASGVSSTAALRLLLDHGASIRGIKNLHAKMYLFGKTRAVATSANLTDAALMRNHEFGFVAEDPAIVAECHTYFDRLWSIGERDLARDRLDAWDKRVSTYLIANGHRRAIGLLGDEGAEADIKKPAVSPDGWLAEAAQAFVKFLGEAHRRKTLDHLVIDEVKRAGCHWGLTYPNGKRPRSVRDGALMFIGRLTEDPNDIRVFGRAIGMRHVPGRDDATDAEKLVRDFKVKWPHYIRVHHGEFLNGTMAEAVSLYEMMDELGPESFAPTQRNRLRGEGNLNPRESYSRQPSVELSAEGRAWLTERLELAFRRHGTLSDKVTQSLDWPSMSSLNGAGA